MNITPHTTSLPIATVINPPTEGLRRENNQREMITQVTAPHASVAEKGVASDKERGRTPAQVNEQIDFANLRKQAEQATSTISEQHNQQGDPQQQSKQESQQNNEEKNPQSKDTTEIKDKEDQSKANAEAIVISQLQLRDKEVRAHELAHASTGGAATGSPSYTFEVGPDGKKYAVGGEVSVDLSSVSGNPQATITKMQKVHAAALAPANPSSQDTRVAASAVQIILTAQSELLTQSSEQGAQLSSNPSTSNSKTNATTLDYEPSNTASSEFDMLINQTLTDQDEIMSLSSSGPPTHLNSQEQSYKQSSEVQQRSQRIESYYFKVSQGYEKPDNFQFELTA